jgi:hypothetical protein
MTLNCETANQITVLVEVFPAAPVWGAGRTNEQHSHSRKLKNTTFNIQKN